MGHSPAFPGGAKTSRLSPRFKPKVPPVRIMILVDSWAARRLQRPCTTGIELLTADLVKVFRRAMWTEIRVLLLQEESQEVLRIQYFPFASIQISISY